MATLLSMVNDLRVLLREEQIDSISDTDEYTQALIPLINKAAGRVLESRTWSFDKRFDGEAAFPAAETGTHANRGAGGPTLVVVFDSGSISTEVLAEFFTPNLLSVRFRRSGDADRPGLSYFVTSAADLVGIVTLQLNLSGWLGEEPHVTDAAWILYATDRLLPSTVRKVLSVRDEERPWQLFFTEDEIIVDRMNPRPDDAQGDSCCIIVGGTATASYDSDTDSAGSTGMRMRITSVPTSDVMLYYTYVYRHAAMSNATDTLTAVPDNVISLIVDQAFYYCLSSNIEADPVRAKTLEKQIRIDVEIAGRDDRKAPNRRRVMRPVGAHPGRHPNSRWIAREVPSP